MPRRYSPLWAEAFNEASIKARFAQGAWWSVVASVLPRCLTIIASIATARILGKEGFGELGMVQSTVMMFGTFAGMGLGLTATKYVAELRTTDTMRVGRILGFSSTFAWVSGLTFGSAILAMAPLVAARALAAPQLTEAVRIGSLLIMLGAITGEQTGALTGFEAFKKVAYINILTALATLILMAFGVVLGGLLGVLWGLVAASALNWWLNSRALRSEMAKLGIQRHFKRCFSEWPMLVSFSLPAVASAMLAAPVNWICNAMVANGPHGYLEMGALNAANQIYYALLFFPGMLVRTTTPILAERWAHQDKAGCRQLLSYSIRLNAVFVLPVVVLGCATSPMLMAIYGREFQGQSMTLAVALLTSGILAIQMPIGQLTAATSRMWMESSMNLAWALIFFAGTKALVAHGSLGLVSARLVAYLFHTGITLAYAFWMLSERCPRSSQAATPTIGEFE